MHLVVDFERNWAKWIFLPQKRRSATFRWDPPFSIAFLWSQSSGFASNFRNLVRNCDFGRTIPARLTTLQKKREKSENSVTRLFFLVWRLSIHKITANYILTKFRDILSPKSTILANFLIFGHHHWNWTKGSKMAVLASFWAKKTSGWVSYTE